ncbi:uncharacterized protein LOC133174303 isoform X2 [Saccostrea echinata]|nr:uncharacterized protein LOC133174303 isoform X2 [Saccostrea echinata]
MDGRRLRSGRKQTRYKLHRERLRKPSLVDSYSTDDESRPSSRRYSRTAFPLFSNHSDDEVIQSHSSGTGSGLKVSHSTPSCLLLQAAADLEDTNQDCFPFVHLPLDCKLKILSYLSSFEKGQSMRVCKNWYQLLQTPSLWSNVVMWDFPLTCVPSARGNLHSPGDCYSCYKRRVQGFAGFLIKIQPLIRRFEFKFDIGQVKDGFLAMFRSLMCYVSFREVKYMLFNWKDTPARPFWLEEFTQCKCREDVLYSNRCRTRKYIAFFEELANYLTKIETLILPFDWSCMKNIENVTRLKTLKTLVLEKSSVFQSIQQSRLDKLLSGLPVLRQLMLEIWTPSGVGMMKYDLSSESLEFLDVSQSRGFYLRSLNMPRLKRFRVARHPWNGPVVCPTRLNMPCLYDVLRHGTPNLMKLNEHYLEDDWKDACYPRLEEVFKSVCSCRRHKTGWMM